VTTIDLSGRVALVTGGSRGIGRATARQLARAGADLCIGYQSRAAEAAAVAAEVRALGRRAETFGGDLSDSGVVDRLYAFIAERLGRLDILVANAGIWPPDDVPLREMTEAQWRRVLAANLDSVFLTVRGALRLMGRGGCIVLVGSSSGQEGEPFHADYAASKGALASLAKSLAVECAPEIRVNCIAPGWVDTDLAEAALAEGGRAAITARIPLGQVATADDVAGPILFLCSDLARHVTGEVLNVNGGSVLCG
jgi:3-oxoacyl-[acyl-carrier protein] reductase